LNNYFSSTKRKIRTITLKVMPRSALKPIQKNSREEEQKQK
jgi:hypothetical protein